LPRIDTDIEIIDAIDNPVIDDRVTIFPNPASNVVVLDYDLELQIQQIVIYDIKGKVIEIFENPDTDRTVLDLEKYSAGIYSAQFVSKKGSISKQFVKE
jgi:hypothetical protein